jgi:ABC-type nitrate/sulfonate/bicarbonate transport system substrate-binding protein
MTLRRRLMALLLGLSTLTLAAACGSSAAPTSSTHATTAPAAPAPAPSGSEAAAPASTGGSSASTLTIHAAYASTAGSEIPLQAAAYGGYFAKNHLNVVVTRINGGSPIVTSAMLSGNIQVAQIGADAPLSAAAHGGHIIVVADILNRLIASLWGNKSVTSVAQLKGKVAAMTAPESDSDFGLQMALAHLGLKYGTDVKPLATGGLPNAYAAMLKGEVAAGMMFSPFTVKARQAGFHELLNLATINTPFMMNGLVTTQAFAQSHPKELVAFLRAYLEAIQRVKSDPAFAKAVWTHDLKVTNPTELDSMYRDYAANLDNPPTPSVAGLQTVVTLEKKAHPSYAKLNLKAIVAPSYLQQAEKSLG